LGRFNADEEIDYTIEEVTRVVRRLRSINPLEAMKQTASLSGTV
jgi:hypothetical protein